jgi:hypothetical protein|tara:strand:- start:114 stop:854 length:741 start_codon:yes stop_codon:yes gene_type:complete
VTTSATAFKERKESAAVVETAKTAKKTTKTSFKERKESAATATSKTSTQSAKKKTSATTTTTTTNAKKKATAATSSKTATTSANIEFEVPNQYGYFPSVIEKAKVKREQNASGFDKDVYMSKAEQTERFSKLCAAHPELKKCQDDYQSPLRMKPSTTSTINGSVIRSDGIILIPGNKEDLITWVLDPAMSADTIGILLPTLFVILGAQLKKAANVPEWVSGGVGITTKIIATCLIALYWIPSFMNE